MRRISSVEVTRSCHVGSSGVRRADERREVVEPRPLAPGGDQRACAVAGRDEAERLEARERRAQVRRLTPRARDSSRSDGSLRARGAGGPRGSRRAADRPRRRRRSSARWGRGGERLRSESDGLGVGDRGKGSLARWLVQPVKHVAVTAQAFSQQTHVRSGGSSAGQPLRIVGWPMIRRSAALPCPRLPCRPWRRPSTSAATPSRAPRRRCARRWPRPRWATTSSATTPRCTPSRRRSRAPREGSRALRDLRHDGQPARDRLPDAPRRRGDRRRGRAPRAGTRPAPAPP